MERRPPDSTRMSKLCPHSPLFRSFARLSEYYGRFLRHGTAYPDQVLRLFDRRRGGFRGDREIHETVSVDGPVALLQGGSEEHTSDLQSLMRTSYAVFCWNKNTNTRIDY